MNWHSQHHTLVTGMIAGVLSDRDDFGVRVRVDSQGNYTNEIFVIFNGTEFKVTVDECEHPTSAQARQALEQIAVELAQS